VDTLTTIISDSDLIPRLEPELPNLFACINEINQTIEIQLYFNFLMDLVKHYNHAIGDTILPFAKSLVSRVLSEVVRVHAKGEKNSIYINKCWNLLRLIAETDSFMPYYSNELEEILKPLFEYMADPSMIEFEDDVVLIIKTFIKKTKHVSESMWKIFQCLSKVFEKNKLCFGNLLDTINQYMLVGKGEIANQRSFLEMLIKMGQLSLFCKEP
jgi:hypothetical protein